MENWAHIFNSSNEECTNLFGRGDDLLQEHLLSGRSGGGGGWRSGARRVARQAAAGAGGAEWRLLLEGVGAEAGARAGAARPIPSVTLRRRLLRTRRTRAAIADGGARQRWRRRHVHLGRVARHGAASRRRRRLGARRRRLAHARACAATRRTAHARRCQVLFRVVGAVWALWSCRFGTFYNEEIKPWLLILATQFQNYFVLLIIVSLERNDVNLVGIL